MIIAGMTANLCVESHVRDAAKNAFDVITVKDTVAEPGEESTRAVQTNFGSIAEKSVTTDEIVEILQSNFIVQK